MRALVVYESMYGSTRVVAGNIAEGLRAGHDVILVPVGEATGDLLAWADLVIVGGPTHMHRLSTTSSRQLAAQAAASQASGLKLDPPRPAAGGPPWGYRERRQASRARLSEPAVWLSETIIREAARISVIQQGSRSAVVSGSGMAATGQCA